MDRMGMGNFEEERAAHCKVQGRSAISCEKTAEPIEVLFGIWTNVGPRNHLVHGVQIVPCEGAIFRGKDMPVHARRRTAVNCAKMAEPIEMPFGVLTRLGPRNHVLDGVQITPCQGSIFRGRTCPGMPDNTLP